MDLDAEQTPSNAPAFLGIVAIAIVVIFGGGLCLALWSVPRHRHDHSVSALGALKTISSAQMLYREGDKDGDGTLQYAADLRALTNTGISGDEDLIDEVLASGTKQGYVFSITSASEFGFTANASPQEDGLRHFGINMRGEMHYSTRGPVIWNSDGSSPDPQVGR